MNRASGTFGTIIRKSLESQQAKERDLDRKIYLKK